MKTIRAFCITEDSIFQIRTVRNAPGPGSNVELNFYGTEASVTIKSGGENWFQAIVDGNPLPPFSVNATTSTVKLVSGLAEGAHHLVLWKRTEASLEKFSSLV